MANPKDIKKQVTKPLEEQMNFTQATKSQAKLRLAIYAPSGAGKTYSALRIATGMGGKIAVIDTENGSASKYADRFNFDTLNLTEPTIENYVSAIMMAGKAKYDVLIIDSMSQGWQDLLERVDRIAKDKYKGNTWSAWSDGTPIQKMLVNSIIHAPMHVIVTMRSKTEWAIEKDDRTGKSKPVKLGLAPEQGKGIEYEFDMLMELNTEHYATISKDRTGKYQDAEMLKPGEDFGKELMEWLSDGIDFMVEKRDACQKAIKPFFADGNIPDSYIIRIDDAKDKAVLDALYLELKSAHDRKAKDTPPNPPAPEAKTETEESGQCEQDNATDKKLEALINDNELILDFHKKNDIHNLSVPKHVLNLLKLWLGETVKTISDCQDMEKQTRFNQYLKIRGKEWQVENACKNIQPNLSDEILAEIKELSKLLSEENTKLSDSELQHILNRMYELKVKAGVE